MTMLGTILLELFASDFGNTFQLVYEIARFLGVFG